MTRSQRLDSRDNVYHHACTCLATHGYDALGADASHVQASMVVQNEFWLAVERAFRVVVQSNVLHRRLAFDLLKS